MKIISDLEEYTALWKGAAVTLGDFDGIHAGHRELIQTVCDRAKALHLEPVFLTYDPSPKKILQRRQFDSQIFTREEKISVLQEFPLQVAAFLKFDSALASWGAHHFLRRYLLHKLKMRHLVIGYDHHFGKNRRGNLAYLEKAGIRYNFTVESVQKKVIDGQTVSSTYIRSLLKEGNVSRAAEFLQQRYFIDAVVIHGKHRGSVLGFPTANLHIPPEKIIPREGVYAGRVETNQGEFLAVINIGCNPTFQNTDLSVEVHILDFSGELYGMRIKAEFIVRLRDEKKFSGKDQLIDQITQDIVMAKTLLNSGGIFTMSNK